MSISLRKALSGVVASAAVVVFLAFQAAAPAQAEGKISVKWLGHAAFEITSPGGTVILIDPFIMKNPKTPKRKRAKAKSEVRRWWLKKTKVPSAHARSWQLSSWCRAWLCR